MFAGLRKCGADLKAFANWKRRAAEEWTAAAGELCVDAAESLLASVVGEAGDFLDATVTAVPALTAEAWVPAGYWMDGGRVSRLVAPCQNHSIAARAFEHAVSSALAYAAWARHNLGWGSLEVS